MIDFDPRGILYLAIRVAIAFALATLIGAERQYRQRSAGLRTNVLVAVGAAAFVSLASAWAAKAARRRSRLTSSRASAFSAPA